MGEPRLQFLLQSVQLADSADVGELIAAIKAQSDPPVAIIIDTHARCSVGLKENDATDQGQVVAGIDRIREETGAAVIEIHHTPRGEERERGSTALRAGTDTMMHVSVDGDFATVTVKRQKDIDEGDPIVLRKRIIELPNGRTSLVLVPVSDAEQSRTPGGLRDLPGTHRKILEALRRTDITSNKILLATTEIPERAFYRALRALRDRGLITQDGLRLTDAGRRLVEPWAFDGEADED